MSFMLPEPKSITADEVILKRADWEEFVATLAELLEDVEDVAAVAAARAESAKVAAGLEAERSAAVEMTIPMEVITAELGGAHPLRAWRDYRGWTRSALSVKSGVPRETIEQLEARRKSASPETMSGLARALGIPADVLNEDDEE
jgi:hypothetical protein